MNIKRRLKIRKLKRQFKELEDANEWTVFNRKIIKSRNEAMYVFDKLVNEIMGKPHHYFDIEYSYVNGVYKLIIPDLNEEETVKVYEKFIKHFYELKICCVGEKYVIKTTSNRLMSV